MTTATISRADLLDWSTRLRDYFKAVLDNDRAEWVSKKLGKRHGFLWLSRWTKKSMARHWTENHGWIGNDGMGLKLAHNSDYHRAKDLLEMAETSELSEFRLDKDTIDFFIYNLQWISKA